MNGNVLDLTNESVIDRPVFFFTLSDLIKTVNEEYNGNFNLYLLDEDEFEALYSYVNIELQNTFNSAFYEETKKILDSYRQNN